MNELNTEWVKTTPTFTCGHADCLLSKTTIILYTYMTHAHTNIRIRTHKHTHTHTQTYAYAHMNIHSIVAEGTGGRIGLSHAGQGDERSSCPQAMHIDRHVFIQQNFSLLETSSRKFRSDCWGIRGRLTLSVLRLASSECSRLMLRSALTSTSHPSPFTLHTHTQTYIHISGGPI